MFGHLLRTMPLNAGSCLSGERTAERSLDARWSGRSRTPTMSRSMRRLHRTMTPRAGTFTSRSSTSRQTSGILGSWGSFWTRLSTGSRQRIESRSEEPTPRKDTSDSGHEVRTESTF